MGDFVGPIIEILKCVGPPLYKWIDYHKKLEEYEETFKRTLDELISQKDEIELRLKTEGFGKLPKNEVKNWLKSTQIIIDEYHAKSVVQAFGKRKYFSRASLAKLVEKKIQRVQNLLEESKSFHSLVIDAPLDSGTIFPTTALTGETSAKKYMEEIWRQLMGNEIEKIGVFGMGGVGKTTIMTHVNNRLVREKKFDHVIWVTVSQTLDISKVQSEIANVLKLNDHFSRTKDLKQRAGILLSMLEGKRFVLILDDTWKTISFEEVGIPEPTKQNGCKLVITTRSSEVCRQMGCKPIKVMPLSEEEALDLFLKRAELDVSKVPTLKETVELVLKQCAGLPLAIVTVASSMKGEYDVLEWRNALNELSENIRSIKIEMDDEVFARLKFSYDRLNNENIQRCFLYCALYPEDFDIPKNELVDCWIREGFVDETHNLQAQEDRARFIIKKLINNCLLLESTRYDRSCVKLHDVVRDMSLKYIANKSPLFMVKAGLNLKKVPGDQEWKENLDKVSLMRNRIREIPSSMSSNCKTLSTLLLQNNPLESIPESFFSQMHGLKILNLSRTYIESLPDSISELTNLTALLLNGCNRLVHIPSLAKLRSLGELDLGDTGINEVPAGMEMLANLTSLNLLSRGGGVNKLPAGMFPNLCRLEKLHVRWGLETSGVAVEEATRLKNLDRLVAQFHNLQDFNCCVKSLNSHQYRLSLAPISFLVGFHPRLQQYDANRKVALRNCNICGREEVDSIFLPKDAEVLSISMCHDVRNICDIPTFNTLERLEILHVACLQNLTTMLNVSESSSGQYSHLKGVFVNNCNTLKKMFSSKLLPALKNLEWIQVHKCNELDELIAVDDGDKRNQKEVRLPKLKCLELYMLSNLKSICSYNGVMAFDSLQVIKAKTCPKLKKIISTSKLQLDVLKNLEEIEIEDCDEMEEIIALDDGDEGETSKKELINLHKLKSLELDGMSNLKSICSCNGVMVFDSLQAIKIERCPKLKKIISTSKLQLDVLKNLEEIEIEDCDEMEEIIALDDGDEEETSKKELINLRKLKSLELDGMSNLKSICSCNGVMVFDSLQAIKIERCPKLKKIISTSKLQLDVLKNLEEIEIENCDEMEEIIALDDGDEEETSKKELINLRKLKSLELDRMSNLKSICSCNGVMVFDSLQAIKIERCPKLKKIISTSKLQLDVLKNLEEIEIEDCDEMEEIIALDDGDEEETSKKELINLPKLRSLSLCGMPKLKSIINNSGSNGVMVCESLQQVTIWHCPQLKRLPLHLPTDEKGQPSPPPALRKIDIHREWWEALEWDHLHPHAKSLLLPLCEFD